MKFHVIRKAVLQEDEGREFYEGDVEAGSESDAAILAEAKFGGGYFKAFDYKCVAVTRLDDEIRIKDGSVYLGGCSYDDRKEATANELLLWNELERVRGLLVVSEQKAQNAASRAHIVWGKQHPADAMADHILSLHVGEKTAKLRIDL